MKLNQPLKGEVADFEVNLSIQFLKWIPLGINYPQKIRPQSTVVRKITLFSAGKPSKEYTFFYGFPTALEIMTFSRLLLNVAGYFADNWNPMVTRTSKIHFKIGDSSLSSLNDFCTQKKSISSNFAEYIIQESWLVKKNPDLSNHLAKLVMWV